MARTGAARKTASPAPASRRRRGAPRWGAACLLLLVGAVGAFTAVHVLRAGRDAQAAKAALLRAEQELSSRRLDPARTSLVAAEQSLRSMESELDALGPIVPIAKLIPFVRAHVVAVETIQSAGMTLAGAGLQLADAAQAVMETSEGETPVSAVLERLRAINASLAVGASSVDTAAGQIRKLEGKWLMGPVDAARDELTERLPRYAAQATSTAQGLDALIRFAGGEGPRRYLFLSQNPDEIRPTGGFIGTYGVMSAEPDQLRLERFEPIGLFGRRHPEAMVPGEKAGSPFRLTVPPTPQRLGNVNNTADFVAAAKLATELWNGSGERPVDGVVSFTPAFLARVLGVVGPVRVEEYGETVDEGNLIERFDFYTAQLEEDSSADIARKGFVASLAEIVMQRLLAAPASKWQPLGEAVAKGFEAREAMAWSTDPVVARALADRRWDGTLPVTSGDFFYNGEFGYAAKSHRGLRREFDHHVVIRADGSARITTTMTIINTREASKLNPGSLSYVTIYGPSGAVGPPKSDPPTSPEPALSGHPAVGCFLNATPLGSAKLQVEWEAKDIAPKGPGGTREYSLWWLRVPDHSGDVLNLRVDLPRGWGWKGEAPPSRIELTEDVRGTWALSPVGIL